PEADMGCHPADPKEGAPSGTHDISFYCDDIEKTVAELKARGVEFTGPVTDRGYGLVTHFKVPGGFQVQLYQPRYAKRKGSGACVGRDHSGPVGRDGPAERAPVQLSRGSYSAEDGSRHESRAVRDRVPDRVVVRAGKRPREGRAAVPEGGGHRGGPGARRAA